MRSSVNLFSLLFALLCLKPVICCNGLPEEEMSTPEIIEYYGYPAEIHETTTDDGYILQMHRIPFGVKDAWNKSSFDGRQDGKQRPVFFLQHGLLATSADWVLNLPHQSAGFLLADAGFDVWLGNVRGNFYSNRHLNYSTADHRYWQFTWDEMAEKDLPTMVNAVLEVTKQKSLYYLGHSQGTEIMFARLSSDPKFVKKIRKFFALAPVSSIGHIKGLISYIGKYFSSYIWLFKKLFGTRDFLPSSWLSHLFARVICGEKWLNPLCDNVLFQIGGPESHQFNQSRLLVYMSHTPAGTSTWNIFHWAQMYRSKTIQKFDFGSKQENIKQYGQETPPLYNFSLVNAPTYLYYSENDWLGDAADVKESLINVIPKEFIKLEKNLPHFNHFDFLWGLKAPAEVYSEIIATAKQHSNNRMKLADTLRQKT